MSPSPQKIKDVKTYSQNIIESVIPPRRAAPTSSNLNIQSYISGTSTVPQEYQANEIIPTHKNVNSTNRELQAFAWKGIRK